MKRLLFLFLAAPLAAQQNPTVPAPPSEVYRSVVRIESAVQVPDYTTPWNSGRFGGGVGTGFLVGADSCALSAGHCFLPQHCSHQPHNVYQ